MPFMTPEYVQATFLSGETPSGEGVVAPADVYTAGRALVITNTCNGEPLPCAAYQDTIDCRARAVEKFASDTGVDPGTVEWVEHKIWCRLSASGYMDCTDWHGPFDSLDDAKVEIRDTYEVDPVTGESIDDKIARNSGYHDCPCRDCFEIAIGCDDETGDPSLCHACEGESCDASGQSECSVEPACDEDDDEDDADHDHSEGE